MAWLIAVTGSGQPGAASTKSSEEPIFNEDNLRLTLKQIVNYLRFTQAKESTGKHISREQWDLLLGALPPENQAHQIVARFRQLELGPLAQLGLPVANPSFTHEEISRTAEIQSNFNNLLKKLNITVSDLDTIAKLNDQVFLGYERIRGEWPSTMRAEKPVPLVATKGYEAIDSNSFTITMIHNNLAETFLANPWLEEIPTILKPAFEANLNFQRGGAFGFWLHQPKSLEILPMVPREYLLEYTRRPNNFTLGSHFANMMFDLANDTDDTAVSYLALHLNRKVALTVSQPPIPRFDWEIPNLGFFLKDFRDIKRTRIHPANAQNGITLNSGGYLTWLDRERYTDLTLFEDLDWSSTGIPRGTNDVDCVVNANILTTLAHLNQLDNSGATSACDLLNQISKDESRMRSCGIYYPNAYHFHYAVSKAFAAGAKCLKPTVSRIRGSLRKSQSPNGGWPDEEFREPIQTTLYAVNALLYNIGEETEPQRQQDFLHAAKALRYLLAQMNMKDSMASWPGGVFFSGGLAERDSLIWRSAAYTSSLGLTAISQFLSELAHQHQMKQRR